MRAALIGNRNDMDPGLVGHALRHRGMTFVELHREDTGVWPRPDEVDFVLSLGSSWSAYWPEVAGPVGAEQRFLATSHQAGVPILGLCFGAQQLSLALGGTVERSQTHEIGWHGVRALSETGAEAAGVLAGSWFQWHYDRFSVPTGATALADSPVSPQAFVAGRSLGLQFHPEVTETIVRRWASDGGDIELEDAGVDRGQLLEETRRTMDSVEPRTEALVEWFLREVAQTHT
ncbi:MAG: type 1 glutamine amidotransferase [Acidimicrobiales bacterium]